MKPNRDDELENFIIWSSVVLMVVLVIIAIVIMCSGDSEVLECQPIFMPR